MRVFACLIALLLAIAPGAAQERKEVDLVLAGGHPAEGTAGVRVVVPGPADGLLDEARGVDGARAALHVGGRRGEVELRGAVRVREREGGRGVGGEAGVSHAIKLLSEELDRDMALLRQAIQLADDARQRGRHPFGALVADEHGNVIATAGNAMVAQRDATAHAEVLSIRAAQQVVNDARLTGCTLYVTLEPCAMCAGAVSLARIRRLYFAADDQKGGAVEHGPRFFSQPTCHHAPEVYGGIRARESAELLRSFFSSRR